MSPGLKKSRGVGASGSVTASGISSSSKIAPRLALEDELVHRAHPPHDLLREADAIDPAARPLHVGREVVVALPEGRPDPGPGLAVERRRPLRVVEVGGDVLPHAFLPPLVFLGLIAFTAGLTFGM